MMALEFQAINQDPRHYKKAFEVFTATYDRYPLYAQWLDRFLPSEIVTKLGKMPEEPDDLRVLGVGSGTGR